MYEEGAGVQTTLNTMKSPKCRRYILLISESDVKINFGSLTLCFITTGKLSQNETLVVLKSGDVGGLRVSLVLRRDCPLIWHSAGRSDEL